MSGHVLFRHRAEYAAVLFLEWCFRLSPYRLCLFAACIYARIAFHILGWRRKEAQRRVKSVFPAITDGDARKIAYESLRNLFLNIAEMMHLGTLSRGWVSAHVSIEEGCERLIGSVLEERGVVFALPHAGNWDLAGRIVSMRGVRLFSIAGIQHNPLTNGWMNRKRGMDVLPRGSVAVKGAFRRLKNREAMAILPDVRMKKADLPIPFLGGVANMGRGMALFARRTDSAIIVASVLREGLSRHRISLHPPILPDASLDEEADLVRMTGLVAQTIERDIRKSPGNWFWYNKRWILDPIDK